MEPPALPVVDGMEVPEVRLMRVQPGDVVVVRLHGLLDANQFDAIGTSIKNVFPDNECVVLDNGAEVEVLRKDGDG